MCDCVNVEDKLLTPGFEMKKSCTGKESKVVTTEDVKDVLNDSKEESKTELTEEEKYINQKLSESGIQDEGLGWLEKRHIVKTINVSLNTAGSERSQRSSPRLAKINSAKVSKWVENSFETPKTENLENNLDDINKTKASKTNSENFNSTQKGNSLGKEVNEEVSETVTPKTSRKKEDNKSKKDSEGNSESVKSNKKVHYIRVQVDGSSKEDSVSVETNSNEGSSLTPSLGKKRVSAPEEETVDAAKKLKMEESVPDSNITDNGIPVSNESPLKIELEMERRKNMMFNFRDIETIVSECELRNQKWKETYSKYKCPTRWGLPMVRNCSEKWDGRQIPQNLLYRFQKYLLSNNLGHPIFFPTKDLNDPDHNKVISEINCQTSTSTNCEFRDDSINEFKNIDSSQNSFVEDDKNMFSTKNANSDGNTSGSAMNSENSGRMVLRNRNQYKPVVVDEEDGSSDDSDEWLTKQKPNKKQRTNSKSRKNSNQNNQQLLLKLEKCNISKKNGCELDRKNGTRDDGNYASSPLIVTNTISGMEGISKSNPDLDTEVCPICSLRFKKQLIENHASECASKTYKD